MYILNAMQVTLNKNVCQMYKNKWACKPIPLQNKQSSLVPERKQPRAPL